MKSRIIILGLILIFVSFSQTQIFAQNIPLSEYKISQYITSAGYGPENIINLYNNAEIVLACKYVNRYYSRTRTMQQPEMFLI